MNVKDMVKDGKKVKFLYYKLGNLWYQTECGFQFPVTTDPEEIGDAVFNAEDKALLFMRYIRKHIKFLDDARKENSEAADTSCSTGDYNM